MSRPVVTALEAALDAWDARTAPPQRGRIADGVFNASKARALADPRTHPLKLVRLQFRGGGLTVDELAERSTVSPRTIKRLEAYDERGSDRTWARLARALGCTRQRIDPGFIA